MKIKQSTLSKPVIVAHLFIYVILILLVSSCQDKTEKNLDKAFIVPTSNEKKLSEKEYEDRGKYLVEIIGCHDCHSPKRMGEKGPELISELAFINSSIFFALSKPGMVSVFPLLSLYNG